MQGHAPTINVNAYYTTDICSAINSALSAVTSANTVAASVVLDARGIQGPVTCASNPFYSSSTSSIYNVTGELLLGAATIDAQVTSTIPTRFWARGIGTGSGSLTQNTIIKATSWSTSSCALSLNLNGSSTSDCPVIFIGNPGSLAGGWNPSSAFAAGISNLDVNCNSSTNCIGAASVDIQEQGGIDTVSFTNQMVTCVDFDGSTNVGGSGMSNTVMRNISCTLPTAASGSVTFNGIVLYADDGIAEISNVSVTVPGAGASIAGACVLVNAAYGLNVNFLHCEHANYGIVIGPSSAQTNPTYSVSVTGLTTGNMTNSSSNSAVVIQNASDVTIRGVALSPTTSSVNSIIDKVNSVTLSDYEVGVYAMSTSKGAFMQASAQTLRGCCPPRPRPDSPPEITAPLPRAHWLTAPTAQSGIALPAPVPGLWQSIPQPPGCPESLRCAGQ